MDTKEPVQNPYQAATIAPEHLDEKLQSSSFMDLILAPRRFFLNLKQYLGARYVIPSIFVMGMATVIDRIDMAMLRTNPGSLPGAGLGRFSDSWTSFCVYMVALAGVAAAALAPG